MAYELDQFISDCRSILSRDPGPKGREAVRKQLERLLQNPDFIRKHAGEQTPRGLHLLYEDPELGFQILAHINDKARVSPPHDHGDSWAIYGQATHYTDMIEWEREDDNGDPEHAKLKPVKKYRLMPGHAGIYQDGKIHSIDYPDHCSLHPRDRNQSRPHPSRALRPEDRRSQAHDAAAGDVTASVSPADLRGMLGDGRELALVDVREELIFSQNHLLLARSVPLSRFELLFARLVPRRATRIVLCDDDDGLAARAAAILSRNGYTNVAHPRRRRRRLGRGRLRAVLRRERAEQGVRRIHRARQRHAQHCGRRTRKAAARRRRPRRARQPAVRRICAGVDPDRHQCAGRRTGVASARNRAVAARRWSSSIAPAAPAASSARSR